MVSAREEYHMSEDKSKLSIEPTVHLEQRSQQMTDCDHHRPVCLGRHLSMVRLRTAQKNMLQHVKNELNVKIVLDREHRSGKWGKCVRRIPHVHSANCQYQE